MATATIVLALAFPSLVTLDGVAGVRPGMTVPQVEARWGVELRPDATVAGRRCTPAFFRTRTLRGYAIFHYGRFGGVFFERGARTGRGVAIGSTLADLRRAYGALLRSRRDAYGSGRNYFVRRRRAPHWVLRFDVAGPAEPRTGRVTRIAFGTRATASLTEGCA